jgi:HK97 family phage major capsid protein
MPGATDVMLARLQGELEERSAFQDQLVEGAQNAGRDLNEQEMELYTRASERIQALEGQLEPLRESVRIAISSRERTQALQTDLNTARGGRGPSTIEYRSIGAYLMDVWRSGLNDRDAAQRVDLYHRAAAHQTTADNPGLLPEQILGPILNFVDTARPIVNALGPRQLPSGSWSRPRVTQHTLVGKQTGEKTELPSRKLILGKIPVAADTYGGYVNVSRQNIDWTQPQVMDIVVNDLAGQYAIETEEATADALWTAGTAGPILPADATAADVAAALWTAAGTAFAAMQGQGSLILAVSPDMLGLIGPLFAPINPQNAQSSGFSAGQFGSGAMGAVSGISVVMSAALDTGQIVVISTAAAEVYEDRIGALQVVEPSVLGVQVAYAGYFAPLVLEPAGVIKITQTAGP